MPISNAVAGVQVGTIADFAGSAAPAGWLLCTGAAISRTAYAALFAVIGTAYGVGDGSTTFNIPDARGRVIGGKDDMGGAAASRLTSGGAGIDGATLGAAGGVQTVTLIEAQIPSHTHGGATIGSPTDMAADPFDSGWIAGAYTTGGIGYTGGSQAHQNAQPTLIANKIIKY